MMANGTAEHAHLCEQCRRDLESVRAVVFGDGEPEKSLLVRMQRVEQRLGTIQRLSLATLCGVGTLIVRLMGAWIEQLIRQLGS